MSRTLAALAACCLCACSNAPSPPESTIVSPVAGAATLTSTGHVTTLTVGAPISVHHLETTQHTLSLGVGLAAAP